MQTEAELCNVALGHVGHGQFIDSLEEATAEAQCCKVAYSAARDELLARYPWPWATRHATLALLDGVTRTGWQYAYQLPTDAVSPECLALKDWPWPVDFPVWCRAWWVRQGSAPAIPYALELSDDGAKQILVTNLEKAELLYTVKVEKVPAMPVLFQSALALEVAVRLARSLVKDAGLARSLKPEAEIAIERAWAQALNSQQPHQQPVSSFISGRW